MSDEYNLQRSMGVLMRNQNDLLANIDTINRKVNRIMTDLSALRSQVEANTQVDQSAIALLNGLSEQLRAVADNPAEVQALANELQSTTDQLAAAVSANTPQAQPDNAPEAQPAPDQTAATTATPAGTPTDTPVNTPVEPGAVPTPESSTGSPEDTGTAPETPTNT